MSFAGDSLLVSAGADRVVRVWELLPAPTRSDTAVLGERLLTGLPRLEQVFQWVGGS